MTSRQTVHRRRTKMTTHVQFAAAIALAVMISSPARAAETPDADIERLIRSFLVAQRDRDVAALRRLTAPGYQEVSPIGDVDRREAMIGFYAPAPGKVAPRIEPSEFDIRRNGNMAIAIVRLTYALPPPRVGGAVRVTYVAGRRAERWLLDAVQYTPIRAPAAISSSPPYSRPSSVPSK